MTGIMEKMEKMEKIKFTKMQAFGNDYVYIDATKMCIRERDYTEATGHSFSDKWITDGKNHWHECTVCGAKKDVAAHIFEWNRDSEDANIRLSLIHI